MSTAAGGDLAGIYPNPTVIRASGPFALTGIIKPVLAGNQNDWNPTGLATASTILVDGGAADRTLTGLAGGSTGRIIVIQNVGTTNSIILSNLDGSSAGANQFSMGGNVSLEPGQGLILQYDAAGGGLWHAIQHMDPYGIAVNTVCQGNDSRLSDARTPVGTALLSAKVWVGSAGNVAAAVAVSGDIALTNAGAATIQAGAVTYAKMQNVSATSRVLGRITAGAGSPEELTAANVWTILGVSPAANFPALTGDVTTVAGALATTIATAAVTLAKMADVATATVFYRKTAGTGVPEVQTLATLKTDLGLTGTNSGDQTIALTGDVTGSGAGSFAATIAAAAVTLAKEASSARPVLNHLINGGFRLFQRQTPGTLTTRANDAYGPDRWRSSRENADLQTNRTDTAGVAETGLAARYYGNFKKITNSGKALICQPVEGVNTQPLQGRTVTFQCKMKCSSNRTVRLGVLYLTSSGTIDTIPAAIVPTTWGAASTDPTFGSNLSLQAPAAIPTGASGTISGNAVNCAVVAGWTLFAGSFALPSNFKNLLPMLWSDGQLGVNDILSVAEAGLYDGDSIRDWLPLLLGEDILLAQRFYEKSWPIDTAPGTTFTGGDGLHPQLLATASSAGTVGLATSLMAQKRGTPTLTLYDGAGTSGKVSGFTGAAWVNALTPTGSMCTEHVVFAQYGAAGAIEFAFTAESEL